jgi:ribose-phosphate pyrophosphokinase
MIILTGNSNIEYAEEVAKIVGVSKCDVEVGKFNNGEIQVSGISSSLRGEHVYIIHSIGKDVNEEIMETLILANAAKYASAEKVCLVVPNYPYARQDKKLASREPITARLIADIYKVAGISSIVTVDLHNPAIQGFFSDPSDNLTMVPIFTAHIKKNIMKDVEDGAPTRETVVVSPDAGGAKRALKLSQNLGKAMAMIHKERKRPGEVGGMRLLGDVKDADAIIVDDIADTCGTLCRAAALLKEEGAATVRCFITHAVLSGEALKNIEESCIDEVYVSDTVNLLGKEKLCNKIKVITSTQLIADAIKKHYSSSSMGELFNSDYGFEVLDRSEPKIPNYIS